jgi:20S proteasome alpha/beta subunit
MALGSGASLALGQLEAADPDSMSVSAAESFATELFDAVAERDPGTGDEADVWTLADVTPD